ncbi:hypothetical protein [Burkholderia savannae]|uniref:hypothetical protein n=1 Tax=Burkholderia savannae TaxID=1637837 RepID=UPI0012E37F62|nr:hypothetical protein [Burkholderia savannae]
MSFFIAFGPRIVVGLAHREPLIPSYRRGREVKFARPTAQSSEMAWASQKTPILIYGMITSDLRGHGEKKSRHWAGFKVWFSSGRRWVIMKGTGGHTTLAFRHRVRFVPATICISHGSEHYIFTTSIGPPIMMMIMYPVEVLKFPAVKPGLTFANMITRSTRPVNDSSVFDFINSSKSSRGNFWAT